jgi:hypothetical protein|tara:strand:- start:2051 stop:2926 length:876 start_codon:yes stop_codon:yes gene_type:complete
MSKRIDMSNDTAIIEYANGEVSHHNPKFKMEHFVGGSMLTPFKRMHQYLVELRTKQDSFLHCEWELKKKEIELLIEEKKYKRAKDSKVDELEAQYIELDLLNIRKDCKQYRERMKQALREKDDTLELIRELNESPEGKLEDGTPIMDVFGNKELEEKLEKEYWTLRMAKQCATEMLAYGKIGTGNIDAIAMLPPPQQKEILKIATDYTVRFDINMNQLTNQAVSDLRIGYVNEQRQKALKSIGISQGVEDPNLLKNIEENHQPDNNTLINNKYNNEEQSPSQNTGEWTTEK